MSLRASSSLRYRLFSFASPSWHHGADIQPASCRPAAHTTHTRVCCLVSSCVLCLVSPDWSPDPTVGIGVDDESSTASPRHLLRVGRVCVWHTGGGAHRACALCAVGLWPRRSREAESPRPIFRWKLRLSSLHLGISDIRLIITSNLVIQSEASIRSATHTNQHTPSRAPHFKGPSEVSSSAYRTCRWPRAALARRSGSLSHCYTTLLISLL